MNKINKKFEFLEHTADLEFISYGETLNKVFENSAQAFATATLNPDSVEIKESRRIKLFAPDPETLMHDWLSELLFLFEVEFMVFREFKVEIDKIDEGYELSAECFGEELDLKRHTIETEIKAVTYHQLKFEKIKSGFFTEVIFDI